MLLLDYENYLYWAYAMRWALQARGLWELVNGQEEPPGAIAIAIATATVTTTTTVAAAAATAAGAPPPPPPAAAVAAATDDSDQVRCWQTRNAEALALITSQLSEPLFGCIVTLDRASQVWHTLAQQAEYERPRRAMVYEQELSHLQLATGGNAMVFLTEFKQLVAKLHMLGRPLDVADQMAWLLQALPRDEYGGLVDILLKQQDQRPATEQELERICCRILNAFSQRHRQKQDLAANNGSFSDRVVHKPASPRHPPAMN